MKWLLLALALADMPQPALVIVCELGGVTRDVSHVASGSHCVLHDRSGSATSAGAISVYDDSEAVP